MNTLLIFIWVCAAMFTCSIWESLIEGRNAWHKGKHGWKIKIGNYYFAAYHFYLFWIMFPILLSLPLVIYGWDTRLLGILLSAYFIGLQIQDFGWYVVNPKVKLSEFWTKFSDYYPWVRIGNKKIIPVGYVLGITIAILSWYFLWR